MSTTPESELDLEKIKSVIAEKPRYKAIFETYLERRRGRQDSTPSRMRRVLRETNKGDYPLPELMEFYREMQEAGAGRWVAGRHGKEGRFLWGFDLISVAEAVLNRRSKTRELRRNEKDGNRKALPKGTLIAPPSPRTKLPKVVMAEPEPQERPEKKPAKGDKGNVFNVSELKHPSGKAAPSSGKQMLRINLGDGQFIEAPLGMSQEQMKELAFFVKTVKEVNG